MHNEIWNCTVTFRWNAGKTITIIQDWAGSIELAAGNSIFHGYILRMWHGSLSVLLKNQSNGIYNMTAPGYSTNKELTEKLGRAVKKHAVPVIA